MAAFFLSAVLLLAACGYAAVTGGDGRMRIVEAGLNGRKGPYLTNGAVVCPTKYKRGFSVECISTRSPVEFIVNGDLVKTEEYKPFFINANRGNNVFAWTTYPRYPLRAQITCRVPGGAQMSVNVLFACAKKEPVVKPLSVVASEPMTVIASKPMMATKPVPVMEPEPTPKSKPSPPPKSKPSPSPKSKPSPPPKSKPSPSPKSKPSPPPKLAPISAPRPVAEPVVAPASTNCVKISALSHMGELGPGWTATKDGVTYREDDPFAGTVPAGTSPLRYMFVAPTTGRFAITVDMTTRGGTEHNDIFLKMFGGFQLWRKGAMRKADGYVKAYHNANGRSIAAYSVDNEAHSFATGNPLRSGKDVLITVGARSTKVTVHRIFMWPCADKTCDSGTPEWRMMYNMCTK